MEKEQNLRQEIREKQTLLDYIKKNSQTLVRKEDFTEELEKLAKPEKAMVGYYDSSNVNFSVEGYDDEIEDQLMGNGLILDQPEEFRSALYRQLNS